MVGNFNLLRNTVQNRT